MIKYFQTLLNECIDLQENKMMHKNMLLTLETMKNNLNELKGGN